jgi:hypothetical protein
MDTRLTLFTRVERPERVECGVPAMSM